MDEVVNAFLEEPSEQFLVGCMKDRLAKIADYYELDVGDKRIKETLKANLKINLFKMKVLGSEEATAASEVDGGQFPPVQCPGASLSFEQQKELLRLHMKLETERLSFEKTK